MEKTPEELQSRDLPPMTDVIYDPEQHNPTAYLKWEESNILPNR